MPELPEVETIRLQLEKYLRGHKIVSVEVRNKKVFQGDEEKTLGSGILGIRRFAKVVCIDLSNKYSILVHVKLTGQLIYRGSDLPAAGSLSSRVVGGLGGPHTLVVFNLDKGGKLYYNDVRRFGWLRVVKTSEVENESFIKELGPDILTLTLENFQKILSKTSRNIKAVLMDQTKIGGIGNIYANDALWEAKISPRRMANGLQPDEQKELYDAILKVLKTGLKYRGASELAFVTPDGGEGEYQNHTLVYGREGEMCSRCQKSKIGKFFLNGRGTYVCPLCQK